MEDLLVSLTPLNSKAFPYNIILTIIRIESTSKFVVLVEVGLAVADEPELGPREELEGVGACGRKALWETPWDHRTRNTE